MKHVHLLLTTLLLFAPAALAAPEVGMFERHAGCAGDQSSTWEYERNEVPRGDGGSDWTGHGNSTTEQWARCDSGFTYVRASDGSGAASARVGDSKSMGGRESGRYDHEGYGSSTPQRYEDTRNDTYSGSGESHDLTRQGADLTLAGHSASVARECGTSQSGRTTGNGTYRSTDDGSGSRMVGEHETRRTGNARWGCWTGAHAAGLDAGLDQRCLSRGTDHQGGTMNATPDSYSSSGWYNFSSARRCNTGVAAGHGPHALYGGISESCTDSSRGTYVDQQQGPGASSTHCDLDLLRVDAPTGATVAVGTRMAWSQTCTDTGCSSTGWQGWGGRFVWSGSPLGPQSVSHYRPLW